jgi:flagellar basal-body rod protein FlgG
MNDALYIAATGMNVQQRSVDTIANNLANVNTPGYKKGRISFEDMVYRSLGVPAGQADASHPAWQGSGVGMLSLVKQFTAGELRKTEMPLDIAIQGEGFIEVTATDGTAAYSRGGTLTVDKDGFLATGDGQVLKPGIHVGVDALEITVKQDGRVLVRNRQGGSTSEAGRIELVRFADNQGLVALGGNLYRPSAQSGDAIMGRAGEDGLGGVAQGYLESSNVQLVQEMVDLMAAQRAYESNVKVIQAADEMLAMSNNLRK